MLNKNNEFLEQYNSIKETFKTMDPKLVEYTLFKFFLEKEDEKNNIKDLFKDDVKNIDVMYFLSLVINILKKSTNKKIKLIEEKINIRENYKEILRKSKELAIELNLSNSLQVCNLYTYLLWNGYFSKDKELKYQTHNRILLPGMYSRDIMNGIGVCLNFSDMLMDFINEFDCYSSANIMNKINKKNYKKHYKVDIQRKVVPEKLSRKLITPLIKPISKTIGNHAYNLINEKGKLYIYDSTNLSISKLNNKYESSMLAGNGTSDIKPYLSYYFNISDKANKTLDLIHTTQDFISPYTSKDFIIIWEECLELFRENTSLLDDFYCEINNNIVNVCNDNIKAKQLIKNSRFKNK